MKRVTVAVLNCTSLHSLCCLRNRKGKSFKQCFYRNNKIFCGIKSYNTCSNADFWHWQSPAIVLPLVYCPVDDMLFKVGPEIRSLCVLNRYCCCGNHTAGSKPI